MLAFNVTELIVFQHGSLALVGCLLFATTRLLFTIRLDGKLSTAQLDEMVFDEVKVREDSSDRKLSCKKASKELEHFTLYQMDVVI